MDVTLLIFAAMATTFIGEAGSFCDNKIGWFIICIPNAAF
jgi:hypothetical protein